MNKKTADNLMIILFILVVIFMAFVVFYIITNKEAFTNNPFIYGASKMGNVECSCIKYNQNDLPSYFFFNDTTLIYDTSNIISFIK